MNNLVPYMTKSIINGVERTEPLVCIGENKKKSNNRNKQKALSFSMWRNYRQKILMLLADYFSIPLYRSSMLVSPLDQASKVLFGVSLSFITLMLLIAYFLFSLFDIISYSHLPATFFAFASILPLCYIACLFLQPMFSNSSRKKSCERELPFVATYLAMSAASGVSIQAAFEHLKTLKYFPNFKMEAMRVEKVRKLYALHPYEAIVFEGKYHPSDAVRELYYSAVAAQKEGGEVLLILKDEIFKLFSMLQGKLKTVSDKFSLIASAEMVAFIMIPMGLITIGVLFSGILGVPMLILTCIVFPTIMAVALSAMIDSYVPKELTEPVSLKLFFGALCAFPVSVTIFTLSQFFTLSIPFYYILGIVIIVFSLPVAFSYGSSRRRMHEILSALPNFTRSIAEEVKKGNSPRMAITNISEGRAFNRSFDKLLHRVATYLKIGCPISDAIAIVEAPWIAKVSFELMDQAEMMGAEPKSLDSLSDLVGNIYLSFKSLESQTRLFTIMSYVNSFVLTFSIVIAVDVVAKLFTGIMDASPLIGTPLGMSFITEDQFALVEAVAYTAVVYDSFLLGILGGKASNGGSVVDGLMPAIICVVITVASIVIFKGLGLMQLFMSGFGGGV